MATAAKFVQPIPIFLAYLVPKPWISIPGKIKFCAKKFPNFSPGTLAFYRIVNI
jgi:hypothetical protein